MKDPRILSAQCALVLISETARFLLDGTQDERMRFGLSNIDRYAKSGISESEKPVDKERAA